MVTKRDSRKPKKRAVKKKITIRKKSNKKSKKVSKKHSRHISSKRRKVHPRPTVKKKTKIHHKIGRKVRSIKHQIVKKIISEPERVSTGINHLDLMTEGGFEKNSTNIVIGGAGTGKTIFTTHFLVEGLKKGEKCLYVAFEEKKGRYFQNMSEFGWNLKEYEKNGLFTFLEYTPEKVNTMLEEGGGAVEAIIVEGGVKRIVIDSMSAFVLLFEDELSKREASLSLIDLIRKWNCTSLLTVEEDPAKEIVSASKAIQFEADSILALYYLMKRGSRKRYLEILKMRGTNHSKNVHEYKIESKGISIDLNTAKGFTLEDASKGG